MSKKLMLNLCATSVAISLLTNCSPRSSREQAKAITSAQEFSVAKTLPRPGEGKFTDELEAQFEALLIDLDQNGPTTVENAAARGMVLYDWGNALSLSGEWIHPDLPALVAVLQEPRFKNMNPKMQAALIRAHDNFIQEFRLRRDKPSAFGNVSMRVLKPAMVNDFHSVEMTYHIGTEPLRRGGGIVAPNHFRFADFQYQTHDPAAPNFVSVRSSNPDVTFISSAYPVTGQYAEGLRGSSPRLMFEITSGELVEGDTVTVTFGDTSQGSPGLQTLHYSNSAMRYPIWVVTGPVETNGVLHALPELPVELLGGSASSVKGFAPATAASGEQIEVTIRTEDHFRNRAETGIPEQYDILSNGEVIDTITTRGEPLVQYPISFETPGIYRLSFRSADGAISGPSSPVLVEDNPATQIFWGETHGHSGWAEGLGLVDNYFKFARDESRLDFVTLSEHDLWMDLGEWSKMYEAVERHHRPGKFLTFMGYEWTAEPPYGGHHNVLFRESELAILASRQNYPHLDALYAGLEKGTAPENVLVVPHAHQPGDWTKSNPDMERLVEIVSYHGTFEWFGRNYLNHGWEVGFIGSSDDHVGSPGYRPRAFGRPGSDNFGGLAAVYAPKLDRDSVFDALRDRRAYATNGERIIVRATLNGQIMGTRLPIDSETRVLKGDVFGTAPISSITLVKNGEDFQTIDYTQDGIANVIEVAFDYESQPPTRRRSFPDATYRGTITSTGLDILSVSAPVAEALNSQTEYAHMRNDGVIDYRLRSGGRTNPIYIEVSSQPDDAATLTLDMSQAELALYGAGKVEPFSFAIVDILTGKATRVLDDRNQLYSVSARMIKRPAHIDQSFEFRDASQPQKGDYYYFRVRQTGGGMAWSSPWWVGEPIPKSQ